MNKRPLAQKVGMITGSARRIGAEIARTLHAEGMNIVLHYNASEEAASQLCNDLNAIRHHSAALVQAMLQASESEKGLIQQTVSIWGRLDALINNASRFYRTNMGQVTEYAWDDLLNTNLKAPFFLSQAAAPYLADQGGAIVNITDIHSERPLRDYSVYCISKAGLTAMTKILAKELGPSIRVNAIAPGAILWPEGENILSEAEKQKILARTSLQRVGEPHDIAKAVVFLLRDAPYVTGQILNVDGGRSL